MDTVTAFAPRRSESMAAVGLMPDPDVQKTLAVTATYRLSEEGRKALLLAGGDGKAVQQLTVSVPMNRLHLVSVDLDGVARLKLRPRYEQNGDQRIVRIDDVPTYDVPPAIDDLFRDAARNHQLERSYEAEQRADKERKRDAYHGQRAEIAKAFLADPAQRALVHPTPTSKRCYLAGDNGRRLLFDVAVDVGVARDVIAEAHKRFRADLRMRRERNLQDRAAQLALHEEKKRILSDFIANYGSSDQQARQTAGVLPMQEAVEAFTDHAFAALAGRPQYARNGIERLQAHVRRIPEFADAIVLPGDLLVTSSDVSQMTTEQWAIVSEYRRLMPKATVTLRQHRITWKRDARVTLPAVFSIAVTQRVEPFTLRREYSVPRQ
jgi:hypothetical protein